MITMVHPLPVGNAARILIDPPAGALYWRLLRRTADAFTGADDNGAVLVADQSTDNAILDIDGLQNGTPYFWHDYAWNGSAWIDGGDSVSGVPDATYGDAGPDVQEIVRSRLAAAMAVEVARSNFSPRSGLIEVVTAPFQLAESIRFPMISVHMEGMGPAERFIGDEISPPLPDFSVSPEEIDWSEGWFAQVTLAIVSVSLNSDERIDLRNAIRRAIIANTGVFAALGIQQVSLNQNDEEDFSSEKAGPLFLTRHTFTCIAPTVVTASEPALAEVDLSAIVNGDTVYA